jgi:hypothetical protein
MVALRRVKSDWLSFAVQLPQVVVSSGSVETKPPKRLPNPMPIDFSCMRRNPEGQAAGADLRAVGEALKGIDVINHRRVERCA